MRVWWIKKWTSADSLAPLELAVPILFESQSWFGARELARTFLKRDVPNDSEWGVDDDFVEEGPRSTAPGTFRLVRASPAGADVFLFDGGTEPRKEEP